jgi:hypothetical protein
VYKSRVIRALLFFVPSPPHPKLLQLPHSFVLQQFLTFVPVKVGPQLLKPLDFLLAQQTLPESLPMVADPFAKFRDPRAGLGYVAMAVIGPDLGQLVEMVCPASGLWLSNWLHLSNVNLIDLGLLHLADPQCSGIAEETRTGGYTWRKRLIPTIW